MDSLYGENEIYSKLSEKRESQIINIILNLS